MVKKLFLVGVMLLLASLLMVGCGVPQEEHDAVVAERDAAKVQVASLQSDLAATQSQLATTESDLTELKAELVSLQEGYDEVKSDLTAAQSRASSLQSDLTAAQSTIGSQNKTMAKAKTFAEVNSMLFIPALTGQQVNEVELLFQWRDKVQATEDSELERLFNAVMNSEGGEQEILDFFLYIFKTLPKILE